MTFTAPEVAFLASLSHETSPKLIEGSLGKAIFAQVQLSLKSVGLINQHYELTPRGWALVNRGVFDRSLEGI